MQKGNYGSLFARAEATGKNIFESSFKVNGSFGVFSAKAQYSEKSESWFIIINDLATGKAMAIGCKGSEELVKQAALWEVKELELLKDYEDAKAGHISFKAYPVVEEAE